MDNQVFTHASLALYFLGKPVTAENVRQMLSAVDIPIDEGIVRQLTQTVELTDMDELISKTDRQFDRPHTSEPPEPPMDLTVTHKKRNKEEEDPTEFDISILFGGDGNTGNDDEDPENLSLGELF